MAKHEENKVIMLLNRSGIKVNQGSKTIRASKAYAIGNKRWGKIDFLCHYCGYTFIWDNDVINEGTYSDRTKKQELREAKKAAKDHMLNRNKKQF